MHRLLTGYDESFCLEFLVGINQKDCLPSINAILSGLEIEYDMAYGNVRYLTAVEVK
ncbi:hypothetical protein [Chroococcidiopsis sp. SAG 2025]|uniref:hypothetical protein n=1 Tax=Chroococcidiopsis sp. SAG 2025 TaxID=171389 RepID=UPI003977911D